MDRATGKLMVDPPWDDCKVAFGVEHQEPVWAALHPPRRRGPNKLPDGWSFIQTCPGYLAGYLAVFRVKTMPTREDGEKVVKILRRIGAISSPLAA